MGAVAEQFIPIPTNSVLARDRYGKAIVSIPADSALANERDTNGEVFSYLLKKYGNSVGAGLLPKRTWSPYDEFVNATITGLGTSAEILSNIFRTLDTLESEAEIRTYHGLEESDSQNLHAKKAEIAKKSFRIAQHVAFSHFTFLDKLLREKDDDDSRPAAAPHALFNSPRAGLLVASDKMQRFVREMHSGQLSKGKIKRGWRIDSATIFHKIFGTDPGIGCPAAYSPLFLDIAYATIDAVYKPGDSKE